MRLEKGGSVIIGFTPAKKVVVASVAPIVLALLIALLTLVVLQAPSRPAYAATDSLPDLGMAHPKNLQIQNTSGRKLLRFDSIVVNVGAGPFELHGQRAAGASTMTTQQRIFDDAGGYRDVPTAAIMYFGGDGHNHWHVRDLEEFELTRLDNGRLVGTGAKHGFCFYDNYLYGSSNPASYTPSTGACGGGSSATQTVMGLSVGWGDIYGRNLPDQYIDITGLTSGRYRLTATADASDWFLESNNANNFSWIDIQLKSNKVSIVAYGPSA
jgi:Lysyl oxidase